ncbi:cupin, partial [Burkholderia multivorans]
HRLRAGTTTPVTRRVGSEVMQVFEGSGRILVDDRVFDVVTGDLVVMPSWSAVSIETETGLDLFAFNDRPIIETLNFARTHVEGEQQ